MEPKRLVSFKDALAADLSAQADRRTRAALRAVMLAFGPLLEVERPERFAHPGPAIFALNHNNSLEAVLVPATLMWLRKGSPVSFLADWMYLHVPMVGWLLRQSGVIPVYGKPARWRLREEHRLARRKDSVLDACLDRLAAGTSVGIFPEGSRNPDPRRLLRGRSGLGELVLQSSSPVLPIGIHYPAARRLGRAPWLGRTRLRPGEPMLFSAERQAADGNLGPRERSLLARRVVGRVMTELAVLSGKPIGGKP